VNALPAANVDGTAPAVDVVVVSWQGFGDASRRIAQTLAGLADVRLRVIYSNAAEAAESGAGEWIQVPNAHFFGSKFARALAEASADTLLLIQADAQCDDWPAVVARFRDCCRRRPRLGLWAPTISYTPWLPYRVDIRPLPGEAMTHVAQTDGIVLGMTAPVLRRLRALDYGPNNIGWGIDWIAICHAYTHGLEVLRDDHLLVRHPRSRGYDTREATRQWLGFMAQASDDEQSMFEILKRYTAERRSRPLDKLKRWMRAPKAAPRR
jgi:hypothetical protein